MIKKLTYKPINKFRQMSDKKKDFFVIWSEQFVKHWSVAHLKSPDKSKI